MTTLTKSFFSIDYNTKQLIFFFKSGKHKQMDYEELKWMVSQLNEYRFFYLLDEIIPHIKLTKKVANLFFLFEYSNDERFNMVNQELVIGMKLNFCEEALEQFKEIKNTNLEDDFFQLFELKSKIEDVLMPLFSKVYKKYLIIIVLMTLLKKLP